MMDFQKLNRLLAEVYDRLPAPAPLSKAALKSDPFAQFAAWLETALQGKDPQANAMCVSTASASGQPAARMVLLKEFDPQGVVFFAYERAQTGAWRIQRLAP